MMGFCKSTFFKRIDSSGFSFLLTLYRHILRNAVFIYAIENKLPLPIGDENNLPEEWIEDEDINDIFSDDNEEEDRQAGDSLIEIPTDMKVYMDKARQYYMLLTQKNNVAWIESTYFKRTLKQHLKQILPGCPPLPEPVRGCPVRDGPHCFLLLDIKVKCLYNTVNVLRITLVVIHTIRACNPVSYRFLNEGGLYDERFQYQRS